MAEALVHLLLLLLRYISREDRHSYGLSLLNHNVVRYNQICSRGNRRGGNPEEFLQPLLLEERLQEHALNSILSTLVADLVHTSTVPLHPLKRPTEIVGTAITLGQTTHEASVKLQSSDWGSLGRRCCHISMRSKIVLRPDLL